MPLDEHAVDPVTDQHDVRARLDMNVACLRGDGIDQNQIHHLDDRRLLGLLRELAGVDFVRLRRRRRSGNHLDRPIVGHAREHGGQRLCVAVDLRHRLQNVAPSGDILEAVSQIYRHAKTLATVLAGVPDDGSVEVIPGTTSSSEAHEIDPGKLAQEAEQAPIVKMVNLILIDAVASKASDIHIEPSPNVVLVRYRIDGMLVEGHQLPKGVQNPLTARIKTMAKADITERRTPQDGHFTIRHDGRLVDVRVSVLPTTDGEKFVMRLLDPNAISRKLDTPGMCPAD